MGESRDEIYREALEAHRRHRGKISVESRMPVDNFHDLSLAYTPGVAEPCRAIEKDVAQVWELTNRGNCVAVVSDGSAVLGLGDIGPEAALPVMEGKCVLFKRFAGIDAFPLVVAERDPDALVDLVARLAPSFGGVNLEDISAPRCFDVEARLQDRVSIPVFHDDQHGTAVIVLAGVLNALKLEGKVLETARIVISGMGAAGTAIARMLASAGARHLVCCGRRGVLDPEDPQASPVQRLLARETNPEGVRGDLAQALRGADVFIGVSKGGTVTREMVASMAPGSAVFALANPVPEIFPEEARAGGAAIVSTGRSDFPNQVNNCLGFPGIFRGALDAGALRITEGMKRAAARALAEMVGDGLTREYIIPSAFDPEVVPSVAAAVARAAREEGVCR